MQDTKNESFEKYYQKYYPQVYGYILKKVLSAQTAEDITMDVFFSCWSNFNTFNEKNASFQTWLYVIVNNKLKNYYRDKKEIVELDEFLQSDTNVGDEVADAMQLQYLRDHLYVALNELNDIQRKIVIFKYFKNMNSNEIAYHTGLTSGNVRVLLKRALDRIKEYFENNNIRWE